MRIVKQSPRVRHASRTGRRAFLPCASAFVVLNLLCGYSVSMQAVDSESGSALPVDVKISSRNAGTPWEGLVMRDGQKHMNGEPGILQKTPVVAIDFETADHGADSACAVGLARVEAGQIVDTFYSLIRPPRRKIMFTWVHGITWNMVRDSPSFFELWPQLADFIEDATCFVAHNAPFDRRVLHACCNAAQIACPELPFICTLKESRRRLHLSSYRLDALCSHCGISLDHHHAGSDARAAAELLIHLQRLDAQADRNR